MAVPTKSLKIRKKYTSYNIYIIYFQVFFLSILCYSTIRAKWKKSATGFKGRTQSDNIPGIICSILVILRTMEHTGCALEDVLLGKECNNVVYTNPATSSRIGGGGGISCGDCRGSSNSSSCRSGRHSCGLGAWLAVMD